MRKYIQSISILLILQLAICADALSPSQILEKAIKRMDGIDHQMTIKIESKDKNDKVETSNLELFVHWQTNQDKYKMVHIKELTDGKKKGRQLWVHTYKDGKEKKWIRMPRSGKIKDLTGKKSSDKVDLSSVTMPLTLLDKEIVFLKDQDINEIPCKVIEVKRKGGNIRLWIDASEYIIHKKQFYDKDNKIEKEVVYEGLTVQDDLKFYNHEIIHNKKKNSIVEIFLTAIEKKTFSDINLFSIPKEK